VGSAVGTYPVVNESMVLYYHFNNQSAYGENATMVYDFSGNGNNGTIYNATFSNNQSILNDGVYVFNGVNTSIGTSKNAGSITNLTVSVWIKLYNITSSSAIIGGSSGSGMIYRVTTNDVQFYPNGATSSVWDNVIMNNHTWYNLVLTFTNDTNTNNAKLYINGLLVSSKSNTGNLSAELIRIGRRVTVDYFNGSMDELIIYNKTLSASEVWSNYHNYVECINITAKDTHVREYTKVCNGERYINGTRIIIIDTNNTYINFTGSYFKGNGTGTNFIIESNFYNLTFDGMNVSDYNHLVNFNNINGFTFKNGWLNNHYNTFMLLDHMKNVLITNSSFGKDSSDLLNDSFFTTVGGLYFRHSGYNLTLENSNVEGCSFCVRFYNLSSNSANIQVKNNYISGNTSKLLEVVSSNNIYLSNNTFNNSYNNFDSYNIGISIMRLRNVIFPSNITIIANKFYNIGCSAILSQGSDNLKIVNNSFYYDVDNMIDKKSNCGYEPITAIDLYPVWKTWISDSTESIYDTSANLSAYLTKNVVIQNNSYTGYPLLLKYSYNSTINITYDFTNIWTRGIQPINYLFPRIDYVVSSDYENVSTLFNQSNDNPVILRDILGQRYPGYSTSTPWISFKLHRSYTYFYNNNYSTGYGGYYNPYNGTWNNTVYNLVSESSNNLVWNTNGSLIGRNIDNVSFTLSPFQAAYVYYNFQLTEGDITTFPESPLTFSSSTPTQKHITSSLSETISVNTIFNVSSCNIDYIRSANNVLQSTYPITDSRVSCNTATNKITITGLNFASGDNYISIAYEDDNPPTGSGGSGGGTSTIDLTSDPKYVNFNYPNIWYRGQVVQVKVQIYNQSDSLYTPKAVKFEYDIDGIVLENSGKASNGEIIAQFKVLNVAKAGNYTIKIIVEDERIVTHNMNFILDESEIIPPVLENKLLIYILWGMGGLIVLVFFVIILVTLTKDGRR
jgi:hypothetical protein